MTLRLGEDYTKLINLPEFNSLFPPNIFHKTSSSSYFFEDLMFGINLFYDVGLMTTAKQQILNLTEFSGLKNVLVRRMVQCNVMLEDHAANAPYVYLLSRTLFQKSFTKNLQNDIQYISNKQKLIPTESFSEPKEVDMLMFDLADFAPLNPYALEYACMSALLHYNNNTYLLRRLDRFEALGYRRLPRFFERAIRVAPNPH